jgi:hypothetical protein
MEQPERPQDQAGDAPNRAVTNVILLLAFAAVVGVGIWLVNAMIDQRKVDDCVAQGRRNCAVIDVPTR